MSKTWFEPALSHARDVVFVIVGTMGSVGFVLSFVFDPTEQLAMVVNIVIGVVVIGTYHHLYVSENNIVDTCIRKMKNREKKKKE